MRTDEDRGYTCPCRATQTMGLPAGQGVERTVVNVAAYVRRARDAGTDLEPNEEITREELLDRLQEMVWDLNVYSDHYAALRETGQPYDKADAAEVVKNAAWVNRQLDRLTGGDTVEQH